MDYSELLILNPLIPEPKIIMNLTTLSAKDEKNNGTNFTVHFQQLQFQQFQKKSISEIKIMAHI